MSLKVSSHGGSGFGGGIGGGSLSTASISNLSGVAASQAVGVESATQFKTKLKRNGPTWAVEKECSGPFYLMGPEDRNCGEKEGRGSTGGGICGNIGGPSGGPDAGKPLTGSTNLIKHYGLETAYHRLCGKRLGEELTAFLPHLTGDVNVPADADGSGLQALIDRPPIGGKEILPISDARSNLAFRLHPGPLPPKYAALFTQPSPPRIATDDAGGHHHRKRDRKKRRDVSGRGGGAAGGANSSYDSTSEMTGPAAVTPSGGASVETGTLPATVVRSVPIPSTGARGIESGGSVSALSASSMVPVGAPISSTALSVPGALAVVKEEDVKVKKPRRPEEEEIRKKKKKDKKEKKKKKEKD